MPENNEASKPNRIHLHRFYTKHLEYWRQSRLSQSEYCRQNDIVLHWFTYWKKRLTGGQSNPTFVPVPINPSLPVCSTSKIDLIIPRGYKIQVGPGFDSATLKQLIHTLQTI